MPASLADNLLGMMAKSTGNSTLNFICPPKRNKYRFLKYKQKTKQQWNNSTPIKKYAL